MANFIKFIRSNLGFILLAAAIILFYHFFDAYCILTGSMEPTLKVGAVVVVYPGDCTPEIGDIAAYRIGSNVIVHRVTDITEDGYILKGDNNPSPDPQPVSQDNILGKAVLRINIAAPIVEKFLE